MKEFNLEEAKAGKAVCTRDGRKARIICFDKKNMYNREDIVALVTNVDGSETDICYSQEGKNQYIGSHIDLMMAPEKKEGWVNIYRMYDGEIMAGNRIYKTKEDALSDKKSVHSYITTTKIEWEA